MLLQRRKLLEPYYCASANPPSLLGPWEPAEYKFADPSKSLLLSLPVDQTVQCSSPAYCDVNTMENVLASEACVNTGRTWASRSAVRGERRREHQFYRSAFSNMVAQKRCMLMLMKVLWPFPTNQ